MTFSALTLQQIRDQVRSVVDIDSSDISDQTLDIMVGQGFDTIVYSEKRWPFYDVTTTFNTIGGVQKYTLTEIAAAPDVVSQGIREITALKNDDHVMTFIGNDHADWNYPLNVIPSGQPWRWTFWEDTVTFYPNPSAVQTVYVRAIRNPTAFGFGSSSGDSPDLPSPFHPILATYATARAYMQQEDPVMANQYQAQFQIELDNVARRYADVPAPQPMIANIRSDTRYLSGYGVLRYANTGGVQW